METSVVNGGQGPVVVESELKDQAMPSGVHFIDLDLLENNPYQPRVERDEVKAAQLRESIASQGQLQPILARRDGSRWQIIFGHGRVEALRKLHGEAKSEAERSRYSKVRAEERSNVSDEQMLMLGLLENIQREDISPLDCAAALARLKSLRPDLQTTQDIARELNMEPGKVKRLLRLHTAPQVIKDAVSKGKSVVVQSDPDGAESADGGESERPAGKTTVTRRLDASSALELMKLHACWTENATEQTASSKGTADERMAALIDRALKQEWGVRRVHVEVEKLIHGDGDSLESAERPGSKSQKDVPFKVNRKKVVIFTSRLAQMNDAQKAELRSVLEPIWDQLGGQIQQQPPRETHRELNFLQAARVWKELVKEMARGWRKLWPIIQVYILGKSPVPADQLPRSVQLPSIGEPRSPNGNAPSHPRPLAERQPVAQLPTGKTEPSVKPPISSGSAKAGMDGNAQQIGP